MNVPLHHRADAEGEPAAVLVSDRLGRDRIAVASPRTATRACSGAVLRVPEPLAAAGRPDEADLGLADPP